MVDEDVPCEDGFSQMNAAKSALHKCFIGAEMKGYPSTAGVQSLGGMEHSTDEHSAGAWTEDTLPLHSTSLSHLCDILSGTNARLLIVGGAGSLYVNPEHTACVSDGSDFPDAFKPLAAAMAKVSSAMQIMRLL